jgi:dephospho-CoA kinase
MAGCSRTSLILGITGGLACGKSEVGRILGEINFSICDADWVAHDLMKKNRPTYKKVLEHFGTKILADDGEINRTILGKIVFKNPVEREVLNTIVHPAVENYIKAWILDARVCNQNAAVLVPLLFESGMNELDWDAIVCVESNDELVLERLKKRGLNPDESALRVASQMPLKLKIEQSDYNVPNGGTLDELKQFTQKTVKRIMAKR